MNTNITIGMELPQLDLSNFINSETGKLNALAYFTECYKIINNETDILLQRDIFDRYIVLRCENDPELDNAHLQLLKSVFEKLLK